MIAKLCACCYLRFCQKAPAENKDASFGGSAPPSAANSTITQTGIMRAYRCRFGPPVRKVEEPCLQFELAVGKEKPCLDRRSHGDSSSTFANTESLVIIRFSRLIAALKVRLQSLQVCDPQQMAFQNCYRRRHGPPSHKYLKHGVKGFCNLQKINSTQRARSARSSFLSIM